MSIYEVRSTKYCWRTKPEIDLCRRQAAANGGHGEGKGSPGDGRRAIWSSPEGRGRRLARRVVAAEKNKKTLGENRPIFVGVRQRNSQASRSPWLC